MHKKGCGQAARLEDTDGERKAPSFWCDTMSVPLTHLTPCKQKNRVLGRVLCTPLRHIFLIPMLDGIVLTEMYINGGHYTITSIHVPKSSFFPMQNPCGDGLCFTLDQNTWKLAQDGQQEEGF